MLLPTLHVDPICPLVTTSGHPPREGGHLTIKYDDTGITFAIAWSSPHRRHERAARGAHDERYHVSTTIPQQPTMTAAARTSDLTKVYGTGDTQVTALGGVSIDIERGRFTAVMGPSGSGKSTFMHCLAGLDRPTSGSVWIGDTELTGLKDDALTTLRRDAVGFIFQSYNLVPTLTALENITLPLDIAKRKVDQEWLDTVVTTVGLADRLGHKPTELSGGQQQRVACARALVSKPQIVFGDEPTGNLDSRAGAEVLSFLRRSVDEFGQTIVMVTHDPTSASYADRAIFLADGVVVDEMHQPTAERVLERMAKFDASNRRS